MSLQYKNQVDRLFREIEQKQICVNPITGAKWVSDVDPIEPQKQAACRGLAARDRFDRTAPQDAPPLPLSWGEREALKSGGLPHIVAWFARSLEHCDYDFQQAPVL